MYRVCIRAGHYICKKRKQKRTKSRFLSRKRAASIYMVQAEISMLTKDEISPALSPVCVHNDAMSFQRSTEVQIVQTCFLLGTKSASSALISERISATVTYCTSAFHFSFVTQASPVYNNDICSERSQQAGNFMGGTDLPQGIGHSQHDLSNLGSCKTKDI